MSADPPLSVSRLTTITAVAVSVAADVLAD
jgi:hypothetical protein